MLAWIMAPETITALAALLAALGSVVQVRRRERRQEAQLADVYIASAARIAEAEERMRGELHEQLRNMQEHLEDCHEHREALHRELQALRALPCARPECPSYPVVV